MMRWLVTAIVFALLMPGGVRAQEYRKSITVVLENSSPFPNHVQVRDMEGRQPLPEDCRVAKRITRLCQGRPGRDVPLRETRMNCEVAAALMDEPRCAIKDLIFDDWMDGETTTELTLHVGKDGFGLVGVRAVNNTPSWTFKPGLRDGDTVQQQ